MPNTQLGKILLLVGQIDGKLDSLHNDNTKEHQSLKDRLDKVNGHVKDHEHRITVIEVEDETEEKIDDKYTKKHQRTRTLIFAIVGMIFTILNVYSHLLN